MLNSKENKTIKEDLISVLNGTNNILQLNNIIKICRAFAVSSINGKIATGHLNHEFIGLKPADIANDCIADLFLPNEIGEYEQLKAYFGGISYETISNEELITYFRKLVFSKVNDGLFRIYKEIDPALSKIIHNIKYVVNVLNNFEELERLGEKCICPSFVDSLIEKPAINREKLFDGILGIDYLRRKNGKTVLRIPDLMAKLSLYLRYEQEYCRIVPIIDIAFVFKQIYLEYRRTDIIEPSVEGYLLTADVRKIICETCNKVKREMQPRYNSKNKGEHIPHYFLVIEEYLSDKFINKDIAQGTLFNYLKKYIYNLKPEDYKKFHKKILEYFLRITAERVKKKLLNIYT